MFPNTLSVATIVYMYMLFQNTDICSFIKFVFLEIVKSGTYQPLAFVSLFEAQPKVDCIVLHTPFPINFHKSDTNIERRQWT